MNRYNLYEKLLNILRGYIMDMENKFVSDAIRDIKKIISDPKICTVYSRLLKMNDVFETLSSTIGRKEASRIWKYICEAAYN